MTMPQGYDSSTRNNSDNQNRKSIGNFWENYTGKKTLHEVVKQFALQNQMNVNENLLRDFADDVSTNLIGKQVDKRKLVE